MSTKATQIPTIFRAKSWTYVDAQQPDTVQVQNTKIKIRSTSQSSNLSLDSIAGRRGIINFEDKISIPNNSNFVLNLGTPFTNILELFINPTAIPTAHFGFVFNQIYEFLSIICIGVPFETNKMTWNSSLSFQRLLNITFAEPILQEVAVVDNLASDVGGSGYQPGYDKPQALVCGGSNVALPLIFINRIISPFYLYGLVIDLGPIISIDYNFPDWTCLSEIDLDFTPPIDFHSLSVFQPKTPILCSIPDK